MVGLLHYSLLSGMRRHLADQRGWSLPGRPSLCSRTAHQGLNSLAIYAKPTLDAVAAASAALDPDRRR